MASGNCSPVGACGESDNNTRDERGAQVASPHTPSARSLAALLREVPWPSGPSRSLDTAPDPRSCGCGDEPQTTSTRCAAPADDPTAIALASFHNANPWVIISTDAGERDERRPTADDRTATSPSAEARSASFERSAKWVERERYRAHRDMSDDDCAFMDFCFYLLWVADTVGVFHAYFKAQGEAFVGPFVVGGAFRPYGSPGPIDGKGWEVHLYTYNATFDGTHKTQVELKSDLHHVRGRASFGQGWKGKIQIQREWFDCVRDIFLDESRGHFERVCAALEMSAVVAHEMLHYCSDWREAPCYALEGYYRAEMTNRMRTNPIVQIVILTMLGASKKPSNWGILKDGCFTTLWPCGTTWSPVKADPCGETALRAANIRIVACDLTRHK
jgi:hypothetical protein